MLGALGAGFVAGVSSQLLWPALPASSGLWIAVLLALPGSLAGRHPCWTMVARISLGAALGIACSLFAAREVIDARLPATLAGQDQVIEGEVASMRMHGDGSMNWVIAVDRLPWRERAGHWNIRVGSQLPQPLLPGERWRLVVRLKPPHAALNPGAADFERYLFGERVVATGYLRADARPQRLAPANGFAAWRMRLVDAALPLLGRDPGDLAHDEAGRFARAVLPALVLDDRSWLTGAQWRVLANTGTAHLVAISGLHVALLWGAVLWLATVLLRRRRGSLRYRAVPVLLALGIATLYAALAGMPLPAARATLMLAVVSVLVLRDGRAPSWRVLLAATLVVLAVDPLAVHSAGFWLSHGAVAALLLLADLQRRRATPAGWRAHVATAWLGLRGQALLSLLIAPLLLGLFGTASTSSVLANVPAIPLVNLVALPAALAGFVLAPFAPGLANPCLDLAVAALEFLWRLLAWIDRWPSLAPVAAPGISAVGVLALVVVVVGLQVVRARALRCALLALLVLAWPVAPPLREGTAQVCVLDVGQGLAVTARTAHHALLYDAGPAFSEDNDAGRSIVVPALRALGAGRLDLLVLSHNDSDHTGGAQSVYAALQPRAVIVGDPQSRPGGTATLCDRARAWRLDGIDLHLLPGAVGSDVDSNDRSCVLRIAAGMHAVLLPGDIPRRRELELAAQFPAPDALAADVLVAAHHGSRGSGSETFLRRVAPREVVFSAGYRNRFGHPHPATLASARRLGASTRLTAEEGAICYALAAGGPPVATTARGESRRFWRD